MHTVVTLSVINISVVDACSWCRCSDDLVKLLALTFLNGETMRSCSGKEIYQH